MHPALQMRSVLSSSNAADESEGWNGYLLGAGAHAILGARRPPGPVRPKTDLLPRRESPPDVG